MSLLEVKNLKKSFGDNVVLKDISFNVEKGEVLSIIGPSGSGKSTLLRCITDLETEDSGEINFDGTFGLVFQNFNLFPHHSVMKNIANAPIKVQKIMLMQGTCSRRWDWKIRKMPILLNCPVDSSKGFLLQGHFV